MKEVFLIVSIQTLESIIYTREGLYFSVNGENSPRGK
jgi:hypothetical protein